MNDKMRRVQQVWGGHRQRLNRTTDGDCATPPPPPLLLLLRCSLATSQSTCCCSNSSLSVEITATCLSVDLLSATSTTQHNRHIKHIRLIGSHKPAVNWWTYTYLLPVTTTSKLQYTVLNVLNIHCELYEVNQNFIAKTKRHVSTIQQSHFSGMTVIWCSKVADW